MRVPLVILALLGALLRRALDQPATQAAAAVALSLPPDKVNNQGTTVLLRDNLSPTWWVYPCWSLHAFLQSFLSQTTSPPYLQWHSLQSTFHRSPACRTPWWCAMHTVHENFPISNLMSVTLLIFAGLGTVLGKAFHLDWVPTGCKN